MPIWVDRRIDPDTRISVTASGETLANALDVLASKCGATAVALDTVVYVGPPPSAAALLREASNWREGGPTSMNRRADMAWPRLTEPRALIQRIAAGVGVSVENLDTATHDLWPEGATPRLAAGDRLLLIGLGCDLGWVAEGPSAESLRLKPLELSEVGEAPPPLASLVGSSGRKPRDRVPREERRYSLRVHDQPVRALLKQLAAQLSRRLVVADDTPGMDRRIGLEVADATLAELLDAIAKEAGLVIDLTADQIVVDTASP